MRLSSIVEAELGGLRLHHDQELVTELDTDRVALEDLSAYYPSPAAASPRGDGHAAAPGAIATAPAARGASAMVGAPAVWVLAIAAISLVLLHKAG